MIVSQSISNENILFQKKYGDLIGNIFEQILTQFEKIGIQTFRLILNLTIKAGFQTANVQLFQ